MAAQPPRDISVLIAGRRPNMNRGHAIGGWILIIIGGIFLLSNLDIHIFHIFWPAIIIVCGLYLIYRAMRKRDGGGFRRTELNIIGDNVQPSFSGEVDGTNVSHFIGDTDLNLTGGTLRPGINRINLSGFIGDIRLFVPKDWPLEISGSAFIGSIYLLDRSKEGIFPTCNFRSADYEAAEKKAKISCSAFIGDIRVRAV
jgi:predicted membrane protein